MDPSFFGRQRECEEIIQHLTSESTRLVSIWGSPGFGKTSIAVAVGHSLQSRGFPVYWISLRGLHSKEDLTSKFLSVFRQPNINVQPLHQSVSLDDKLRQLFSLLSNRSVFILDDADDLSNSGSPEVKEEVAVLLEELLQNQRVALLVTTREPLELDIRNHRDFRIGPLDKVLVRKSLADTYASLTTQANMGDFTSALQSHQRALGVRPKLFEEKHASTADSYYSLGNTQYKKKDFTDRKSVV